jgi:hypothetical protein
MKKFLLSLALVLGLSSYALADDENTSTETTTTPSVTVNLSNLTDGATSISSGSDIISITLAKGSGSDPKFYANGSAFRFYSGNSLTIAADGAKITSIVMTSPASSNMPTIGTSATITADAGDLSQSTTDYTTTWTGSAAKVVFSFSKAARFNKLVISYVETGEVSAPTIALGYFNKVTISHKSAEAIYYTVDGTEPTAASTKYTEPFDITEAVTVKAIAVKGQNTSAVASQEFTPYTYYTKFADVTKLEDGSTVVFNAPVTAIYGNVPNLWVKDQNGGYMLIYDYNQPQINNGDQFSTLVGTYSPYNNSLPEIKPIEYGEVTTGGTAVEPEELSVEEIGLSHANTYVVLKDVAISGVANNQSFTITDADDNSIAGYNPYSKTGQSYTTFELPASGASKADVYGFVSVNGQTVQINPIKIDVKVQSCETPTFTPELGLIKAGDAVTITSATEGATIYYTLDGTEPTTASTQYTEPVVVNANVTIKAIAVKEGMGDSDVTTASFTAYPATASCATFDFSNPESLTPSVTRAANNAGVDVTEKTFTNGDVAISFTKQDGASNGARLFTGQNDGIVTLRLYSYKTNGQATMTVGGENVSNIEYIQLTKSSGSFNLTVDGAYTEADNLATWQHALTEELVSSVKFTTKETTSNSQTSIISTVTVVYTPAEATAVSSVAVDSENAPVEYYNLQGVRVANPTQGLFIRRQGNTVSKVVIK